MSKMSTDLVRHALNGPTMGTRWSALFFTSPDFNPAPVQAALQQAVEEVDTQMSTWKPGSDLMRLNATPVGEWVAIPARLAEVLRLGLEIGRASGGAFDIGMGDAVVAWGFGPDAANESAIRAAMAMERGATYEVLELDGQQARKHVALALNLNGIAKGYGVDRLADVLCGFGITDALVGIDGEMRAMGLRSDACAWSIAIEAPDRDCRAPHAVLELQDAAVATSGDYRHWVEVGGRKLSHTMDPTRGIPLTNSPASVTVVARTCAEADAWATALMVLGPARGAALAEQKRLDALMLMRDASGQLGACEIGPLFDPGCSRRARPSSSTHGVKHLGKQPHRI